MRYIASLLVLSLMIISCSQPVKGPNGVVYKNAVEYNDYIIGRQTLIIKKVMDFIKVSETDLDSARNMLTVYSGDLDGIISEIKGMPAWKGDTTLRDAAINSFRFYKKIFDKDYKRLIDIRKSGAAETEEGVTEMNTIVEDITKEEDALDKDFHNAQKDFATKNKMKLTENDMQKKIDKMND